MRLILAVAILSRPATPVVSRRLAADVLIEPKPPAVDRLNLHAIGNRDRSRRDAATQKQGGLECDGLVHAVNDIGELYIISTAKRRLPRRGPLKAV